MQYTPAARAGWTGEGMLRLNKIMNARNNLEKVRLPKKRSSEAFMIALPH